MEATTHMWNKKVNELSVKETVLVTAATPIIMFGGLAVAGMALGLGKRVANKFSTIRENRQDKKNQK